MKLPKVSSLLGSDIATTIAVWMETHISWWRRYCRFADNTNQIFRALYDARIALLSSIAVLGLSVIPPQSIEAFRVMAENISSEKTWDKWIVPVMFLCAQGLLATVIWFWGRVTLEVTTARPEWPESYHNAARLLPTMCAAIAFFAPIAGFTRAYERTGAQAGCFLMMAVSFFACIFFISVARKIHAMAPGIEPRSNDTTARDALARKIYVITLGMLAIGIIGTITIAAKPHTPRALGAMTYIFLGVAFWSVVANALTWLGRIVRLPLVSLLIMLGVTIGLMDWGDNHQLREAGSGGSLDLANLDQHSSDWLSHRREITQHPPARPFPIVLVAAEGGGIYAAYHAALALGTIQDRYPAFRSHVFGISGVSGGSVGATVFARLCAAPKSGSAHWEGFEATAPFVSTAREVLSADYLTPVMAMAVFPDFMQRFLPFPIPQFDRARGLEVTLQTRLQAVLPEGTPLVESFYGLANSEMFIRGSVPALFLNSTRVETGGRIVLSTLSADFGGAGRSDHHDYIGFKTLRTVAPAVHPTLASAAFASARFPYVTPVAFVIAPETLETESGPKTIERKWRLADGGYFENSALATVNDLLHTLCLPSNQKTITDVHIIVISIGTTEARAKQSRLRQSGMWLGETLSPLRTIVNTRRSRGDVAREQTKRTLHELRANGYSTWFYEFLLDVETPKIPLGWLLSHESRKEIERQISNPKFHVKGQQQSTSEKIDEIISLLRAPPAPAAPQSQQVLPPRALL